MVFKMVMKWPAIAVKAMMVNEMVMETTMMTAIEIAMAMTRMAVEMVMAITILDGDGEGREGDDEVGDDGNRVDDGCSEGDSDGAETNCGIAHILGILLMNSCDF